MRAPSRARRTPGTRPRSAGPRRTWRGWYTPTDDAEAARRAHAGPSARARHVDDLHFLGRGRAPAHRLRLLEPEKPVRRVARRVEHVVIRAIRLGLLLPHRPPPAGPRGDHAPLPSPALGRTHPVP